MEKPSFKLVGAPCGHHGQYTFYKAIRLSGKQDRILAIGDFFFVRIWQDSELVSIGELQLLWTDRVSDQTLVSLRLYFLPENTPDGRGQHGEDEVLAINDKVVLKAEDLLSWVCSGNEWRWGRRAVWRGACAPPSDARVTAPLHQTRLDLSDVDKEKDAIVIDEDSPGVVVFSYPRYCRYRALAARLAGLQAAWLRDSLVAALGGYSAPTRNTRILYCKDTFEYPELEGHEFVCNHLAPRLKGRGRRRRRAPGDRSSDDDQPPRRPSLRGDKQSSDDELEPQTDEQAFIDNLKHFYRDRDDEFTRGITLKDLSLRALYSTVTSKGGYEAVCRHKQWGVLFADQTAHTRRHYERYLLPYEKHERRNGLTSGDNAGSDIAAITSPKHDVDNETGETKEDMTIVSKPAEELNREFLESLPLDEKTAKISVKPVEMLRDGQQSEGTGAGDGFLKDLPLPRPAVYNGHVPSSTDQPRGRSSLRAVRVKPARAAPPATPPTPPASAPAVTNFGIHRPPPAPRNHASDDDIVEVPYKPKTPEIIDLDEYPESPQAVKKKKLDILKERGLEVTALPPTAGIWPAATPLIAPTPVLLNPAVQHQIMTNAQLFQMYNIIPQYPNGVQPPKVIQGTSIFGSSNPEKTVYGNPKDPFMPPPHILHGVPVRPQRSVPVVNTPQDILDLTCKINSKPTVEIVRVPNSPSPSKSSPQNLTKNFSIVDGKAVVGSNLEITLVNKSHSPKSKSPLKRSSNGKFVSNTPTPPKESPKPPKKPNIIVPNYQINENLQIPSQNLPKEQQKTPPVSFLDPYMALYSLAGQIDPRQLAAYRDLMTNQVRGYNSFLNMGVSHPTTKN